ncbi:MAG TPA: DinB family protein [Longimicrobiales bacterium]|nr:DinB family protein [Longimicrobiales bacterium]
MYRRIEDFLTDFAAEAESTLALFRGIPDSAAGQAIEGEGRTLGRLAWHLTCSIGEMCGTAGIGDLEPRDDQTGEVPEMAAVVAEYERVARDFAELLPTRWPDETLEQELKMYGRTWRRGDVLSMILLHQAHHRGQMTVLVRQAELQPAGMYGPTREEWVAYGLPAHR